MVEQMERPPRVLQARRSDSGYSLEFEPVIEIYQGARSSYEAIDLPAGRRRGDSQVKQGPHFAQDALAKGYQYGFISSSDHFSTHNSYAYLYVKGHFSAMPEGYNGQFCQA